MITFCHHPPFSNNTRTGSNPDIAKDFVGLMRRHPKAVAMINGHAHPYEHLLKDGRHYIVSAGGGGPRSRLEDPEDRIYQDLFDGPDPRPLNYLLLETNPHSIQVTVKGLDKGDTNCRVIDRFNINFPTILSDQ